MDKIKKCNHLEELLKAEAPGIKHEIEKDMYYLGQKRQHPISWQEAEKDYIEHYMATWATGFKFAYCNYCCVDRDNCDIKEK